MQSHFGNTLRRMIELCARAKQKISTLHETAQFCGALPLTMRAFVPNGGMCDKTAIGRGKNRSQFANRCW
jgi:hypothetical protein